MSDAEHRIKSAKQSIADSISDITDDEIYLGFIGRGDANRTVLVPNKPGYIYIRIPKKIENGVLTEYTEHIALSRTEYRHNAPVKVVKSKTEPAIYEVKEIWIAGMGMASQESTIGSVAIHHWNHELYSNRGGHDPTMIDTAQIKNLQVIPTSPPSSRVTITAGWYIWKDRTVHWFNGADVELASLVPSGTTDNVYVNISINGDTQAVHEIVETANILPGFQSDISQLVVWPGEGFVPLACVRLESLNYQIGWSSNKVPSIIDMRPHQALMPVDDLPAIHGLNPPEGYHSGTLDSIYVYESDPSGVFSHHNLHDILEEDVANVSLSNLSGAVSDMLPQYCLLAGRAGGQTWIGGTGALENAVINSTIHANKGSVLIAGSLIQANEATGVVTIGSALTPINPVIINATLATTNDINQAALLINMTANPAATDTTGFYRGFWVKVVSAGIHPFNALLGFQLRVEHATSQALAGLTGGQSRILNTSSATIITAMGFRILDATNSGGGTLNTLYGLYIDNQSVGSTNYAIYTNVGAVRFGDALSIIGSVAASVQLLIKGATSQSGNMLAIQDSGANVVASILAPNNANPQLQLADKRTLGAGLTDGYTAGIQLTPKYDAAFTVTRHNYINLVSPVLTNTAVVTDAAVFRFDAALGTHPATTNTDRTGNAKVGTIKVNANGTLYYIQLYA